MNKYEILLLGGELVSGIGLFYLADYAKKVINTRWRLYYLIPAVLAWFCTWIIGADMKWIACYIAALVCAAGFVVEKKEVRCLVSGLLIGSTVLSGILVNL